MGNPYDVGARLSGQLALQSASATAGGSGDDSEENGRTLDLESLDNRFGSVDCFVAGLATLASGETISISGNWQWSSNDSDWTDLGETLGATVAATGPSGGGEVDFFAKLGSLDLHTAGRYVRAQVTPGLSASGTDTAVIRAVYVLGGPKEAPA